MIEIVTFTKTLNATEAGMTNTNDSYILIPQAIDGSLLFPRNGTYKIRDFLTGEDFDFRYESGREQRVYRLGQYCRMNNVRCGDVITLERRTVNMDSRLFINARRKHNIIYLHKHKDGYLIIRNDIGETVVDKEFTMHIYNKDYRIRIVFDRMIKKRKDSPDVLPLFVITVNENGYLQDIVKDKYIELNYDDNTLRVPEEGKLEIIKQ